jgi:hypothetical protein
MAAAAERACLAVEARKSCPSLASEPTTGSEKDGGSEPVLIDVETVIRALATMASIPVESSPSCADAAIFHARGRVGPTVDSYLAERFVPFVDLEAGELVAAFALIQQAGASVPFGTRTAHRLLLAAITISQKVWRDQPFANEYMARVGGVPAAELAEAELALLRFVGWRAHVGVGDFWRANAFLRHRLWEEDFQ